MKPEQIAELGRHEPEAVDWEEAVRQVRGYYPEDVFRDDGESLDAMCGKMARLTCDNVRRHAWRIMRDRLNVDDADPYLDFSEQSDGDPRG